MLIKPDLADEEITRCLQDAYGLNVDKISFLPVGADFNTAVYRITTRTKQDYFLKLRRGEFNEASVSIPKYFADLGFKQVIPPITTLTGQLWVNLASFKASLYSYVDGHNAIAMPLSDEQWIEFGATLKMFHSAVIPKVITNGVRQETFSPKWRMMVKTFLERIEGEAFAEPVAAKAALFLKSKREEILNLLRYAEELAYILQNQPLNYILCHADIHGWNLLIDKEGALFIIDWDTLIFAPKERDLMFIGAGMGDTGRTPHEEEALFYQGYCQTDINQDAISYYRYERIIEDIGEYCQQIFLSNKGEEDRAQSFEYLQTNFQPNGTIEMAHQANKGRILDSLNSSKP